MTLNIKNLHVKINGKEILKGVNLEVKTGEIVALMGPNGSGKSTIGNTIMGHPSYKVSGGSIQFNGEQITDLGAHERAEKGIFLSFQQPVEIPGLVVKDYMRHIIEKARGEKQKILAFNKELKSEMETLGIDTCFIDRSLNEGFSGGEKKRMEMLQLAMLKPKIAILDETDSGLDIDAIKHVAEAIRRLQKENNMSVLIISHYKRMLDEVSPNKVIVLQDGIIKHEGGVEVITKLEAEGYTWLDKQSKSCDKCALKGRRCPHDK
jgi:Fe-S cluster assembly ATP-binding protein